MSKNKSDLQDWGKALEGKPVWPKPKKADGNDGKQGDVDKLADSFKATFAEVCAEAERIASVVKPLMEIFPAVLFGMQTRNGKLTFSDVLDKWVEFFKDHLKSIRECMQQGADIDAIVDAYGDELWLHLTMKDYNYLKIEKDSSFGDSCRALKNTLRRKLEELGLIELLN